MNVELSEDQVAFQETARQFSEQALAPFAAQWDREHFFPKETIQKAGELGFCGLYSPESEGGLGLSRLDASVIFEQLAMGCTTTTAMLTIHNMATWMIATWGSDEVRAKWCPSLVTGEQLASYCLTEPGAGSDAASLKTKAEKKQSGYILNGSKAFISGAGETDVLVVMARTGGSGPKGVSAFAVPANAPGISYGKKERKMGWNAQPTRMIAFDNVEIDENWRLGEEGEGFKMAMQGLDGGRINIATCSVGTAQQALNLANAYLREREQFQKPIATFQALQFKLADMATELVAARQLVRMAACKLDANHPDKST
ncbi:MAG TPA: acyl-CoA dehydrogenase, partial [Alteromonas australica]|nr:acyl-CoA dehydrogenase [Alteromonas australica]